MPSGKYKRIISKKVCYLCKRICSSQMSLNSHFGKMHNRTSEHRKNSALKSIETKRKNGTPIGIQLGSKKVWEIRYKNGTNKNPHAKQNAINGWETRRKNGTLNSTKETKEKISKSLINHLVTKEARKNMRIAALERVTQNGQMIAVGKLEKPILDQQEINNRCTITRHYHIKELGYQVDGYDKINNIVYEVYEPFHLKPKNKPLKIKLI